MPLDQPLSLPEILQSEPLVHRKVLGLIRRRGQLTRQDIAEAFGWLQPSTSKVIRALTDKNLVVVNSLRMKEGDRRRDYLSVNPTLGHAIAVELDVLMYRFALIRMDGEILDTGESHTIKGLPPEKALAEVAREAQLFRRKHKQLNVLGLGVSYGGIHNDPADPSKPVSEAEWYDVPIREILERHTGMPVSILNDLSAGLLAELRYGHAVGRRNVFYLSMKGGLGLGLLSNGRIHRGHNNDSGEFGHICVDPEGAYCHCGGRGCLETVASSWAIIRQVVDLIDKGIAPATWRKVQDQPITLELISQQAAEGVVLAENIMEKAGETIGNLLSMFANCFDPEMIILAGILSDEKPHRVLVGALRHAFKKGLYPSHRTEIGILPTKLGHQASLLGAAAVLFESFVPSYPVQLYGPFSEDAEEFASYAG